MSNVKRISIVSPIVSVRSSISLMRSVKAMVPSFVRSQDEEIDRVPVIRRGRHHGASCVGDVPFPLGNGVTSFTTGNVQSIYFSEAGRRFLWSQFLSILSLTNIKTTPIRQQS